MCQRAASSFLPPKLIRDVAVAPGVRFDKNISFHKQIGWSICVWSTGESEWVVFDWIEFDSKGYLYVSYQCIR